MARYDRIAPLQSPPRDRAIPAWPVLRDLEGRERDADLARRARLRFLALRPVRRLVARGIERVPAESYRLQLEAVRQELSALPARDPERGRLTRFLHQIERRAPLSVTAATLDMGEALEEAGQLHGAEEYYRTGLELAASYGLMPQRVIAHRLLGRVLLQLGRGSEGVESYRMAVELSRTLDDAEQWCRSMDGLAAAYRDQGRYDDARRVHDELLAQGRERGDAILEATALAGLCRTELDAGDAERAVELGWLALPRAADAEQRHALLGTLGHAFAALGLYAAAERCHEIVSERTAAPGTRARALLDLARVAASAGRSDVARERLRRAISEADRHGLGRLLGRAEELLSELERGAAGEPIVGPAAGAPSERSRQIAAEIEALDPALVPASG